MGLFTEYNQMIICLHSWEQFDPNGAIVKHLEAALSKEMERIHNVDLDAYFGSVVLSPELVGSPFLENLQQEGPTPPHFEEIESGFPQIGEEDPPVWLFTNELQEDLVVASLPPVEIVPRKPQEVSEATSLLLTVVNVDFEASRVPSLAPMFFSESVPKQETVIANQWYADVVGLFNKMKARRIELNHLTLHGCDQVALRLFEEINGILADLQWDPGGKVTTLFGGEETILPGDIFMSFYHRRLKEPTKFGDGATVISTRFIFWKWLIWDPGGMQLAYQICHSIISVSLRPLRHLSMWPQFSCHRLLGFLGLLGVKFVVDYLQTQFLSCGCKRSLNRIPKTCKSLILNRFLEWVHIFSEGWASPIRECMTESEFLPTLSFSCLRLEDVSVPFRARTSTRDTSPPWKRLIWEPSIWVARPSNPLTSLQWQASKLMSIGRIIGAHFVSAMSPLSFLLRFIYPHILKSCPKISEPLGEKSRHTQNLKSCFGGYSIMQTTLFDFYSRSCLGIGIVRQLFDEMDESNVASRTVMISSYSQLGQIGDAVLLFEEMYKREATSWNVVIAWCTQNGLFTVAISLFRRTVVLANSDDRPNQDTVVRALLACGHLHMFQLGKWKHGYMYRNNLDPNSVVSNGFVDMSGECGSLKTFKDMYGLSPTCRCPLSWSTVIPFLPRWQCLVSTWCCVVDNTFSRHLYSGVTFLRMMPADLSTLSSSYPQLNLEDKVPVDGNGNDTIHHMGGNRPTVLANYT